jgi:hypothetical protein
MIESPVTDNRSFRGELFLPNVFGTWLIEGARTAAYLPPRWRGLSASPSVIAVLTLSVMLLNVLLQRWYIVGPADFYWQAVAGGWISTAFSAWVCYLMRPQPLQDAPAVAAPSAAHLFGMVLAQSFVMMLAFGLMFVVYIRTGLYASKSLGKWSPWVMWLIAMAWTSLAQLWLLWRGGSRRLTHMLFAFLTLTSTTVLFYAVRPAEFWYPEKPRFAQKERKELVLTQEVMEAQPQLLARRLKDIRPQRPGIIDLYSISFAPYADEDVFRRESEMVSKVMEQRFDAAGRTIQLVNHAETIEQWPWATPMNLRRTIRKMASVMDRDEDILFLHLTSHGARDGELSADFWPMAVAAVRPADLKLWLDEAGIKYRILSISACFAGSWITPLSDQNTLVMTASDAEHTSYGCGRKSDLTYFGRAMYDEQLRKSTLSFEAAHAAARKMIKVREEEAGKDDGYSNPQIKAGEGIKKRLNRLEDRLRDIGSR